MHFGMGGILVFAFLDGGWYLVPGVDEYDNDIPSISSFNRASYGKSLPHGTVKHVLAIVPRSTTTSLSAPMVVDLGTGDAAGWICSFASREQTTPSSSLPLSVFR